MYGISLDDRPDNPVGTPEVRRTKAIHWNWTTDATQQEIADALGVSVSTIQRYLNDGPTEDVRTVMENVEAEVRMIAVAELRDQLKAAGSRSKTAEKPVKVYENDSGELEVIDIELEGGGEKKIPKVQDIQLLPDEEARYYARDEVRDIINQLTTLVGAGEPDKKEIEHSGRIDGEREHTTDEATREAVRAALEDRYDPDA